MGKSHSIQQQQTSNEEFNAYIEKKCQHLTTTSEWSLDSINEIINTCKKEIFGSKEPITTDDDLELYKNQGNIDDILLKAILEKKRLYLKKTNK